MHNEAAFSLTHIAVILAAAFAVGAVVKRLNQPVLVGYILAGVALGPTALGIVANHDDISFLAELGILLLLFVVGMELDAHRFAEVYKVATVTALGQIAASLAIVAGAGALLGWDVARIVVFGFAIATSSTAVGIRLLDDMGETGKPTGNTAIGILIAQDLALIPMLLIVDALQPGNEFNMWALGRLGVGIAVMMILLYGMARRGWTLQNFTPRWLHLNAFADKDHRMLAALAFCFGCAALAGAVGLSASYGAFLAGLLIGSTSESHAYEKQIKPIFDLLIMVFFFSVGLLLDVPFIMKQWMVILTLLFSLMLVKTIFTTYLLSKLGLSRRHALLIGAALGQVGEFAFVIAALGLSMGAVQEDEYKILIAVVALSLIITPIWLVLLQRAHVVRNRIVRSMVTFPEANP